MPHSRGPTATDYHPIRIIPSRPTATVCHEVCSPRPKAASRGVGLHSGPALITTSALPPGGRAPPAGVPGRLLHQLGPRCRSEPRMPANHRTPGVPARISCRTRKQPRGYGDSHRRVAGTPGVRVLRGVTITGSPGDERSAISHRAAVGTQECVLTGELPRAPPPARTWYFDLRLLRYARLHSGMLLGFCAKCWHGATPPPAHRDQQSGRTAP